MRARGVISAPPAVLGWRRKNGCTATIVVGQWGASEVISAPDFFGWRRNCGPYYSSHVRKVKQKVSYNFVFFDF